MRKVSARASTNFFLETRERAALYLTVRGGSEVDHLEGLEVEGVENASLHRTARVDGMMRMEPVPGGFAVPEAGWLRLRPGGNHAMLEGLPPSLSVGDSLRVTLHFRSGAVETWATVVPLAELETLLVN